MARLTVIVFSLAVGFSFGARPSFAQKPGCYIVWADAPQLGSSGDRERSRPRRPRQRFHYSAAEVLDIDFYVLVSARSDRRVEIKIYTPQGHLYQTLATSGATAFDANGSGTGVGRGRRTPRRFAWVQAKLPVAGTSIVNSSLYGAWTAVPIVKGDDAPCARTRSFHLRP